MTTLPDTARRALLLSAAAAPLLAHTQTQAQAAAQAPQAQQTVSLRDFTHDPLLPALGNPQGDVTIVKFFDYQCAYCKRGHVALQKLLAQDPKVRVVMRDLFVYGETSRQAARLALASAEQGKYVQVVHALMEHSGRLNEDRVNKVLRAQGVDTDAAQQWVKKNQTKVDALFARNQQLARMLEFRGTPSYLIGRFRVPGAVTLEQMQDALAQSRAGGPVAPKS